MLKDGDTRWCTIRSGIGGPTGVHRTRAGSPNGPRCVNLGPLLAVSCIRRVRSRRSPAASCEVVGFHRPHDCATNWMGALIAGTWPSCASNLDVVLCRQFRRRDTVWHPWVGAAETAPLFVHCPRVRREGRPRTGNARHLSARPPCGATRCASMAYGRWAQVPRHGTPICRLRWPWVMAIAARYGSGRHRWPTSPLPPVGGVNGPLVGRCAQRGPLFSL